MILSFGLLGPGKGYELALDALPAVVAAHPNALYVSSARPTRISSGPRARPTARPSSPGRAGSAWSDHVRFVDRFVGRVELTRWLQAADVFVTPYPNLDQIVSGTLSYAMGAGRAVVSTPYAYANELLADGRGVLVAPGSASESRDRPDDGPRRRASCAPRSAGVRMHTAGGMVWSAVGAYGRLFAQVAADAVVTCRLAPSRR